VTTVSLPSSDKRQQVIKAIWHRLRPHRRRTRTVYSYSPAGANVPLM